MRGVQECPTLYHMRRRSLDHDKTLHFAWTGKKPGMCPASHVTLTRDLNLSECQPHHASNGDNCTQHRSWRWTGGMNRPGYSSLKYPQGSLPHLGAWTPAARHWPLSASGRVLCAGDLVDMDVQHRYLHEVFPDHLQAP